MVLDLSKQRLPAIYKKGGKECYLDPVRKKLIYVTPEETVRQKVISYLIDTLHVPIDMILAEEHLSHYRGVSSRRRADIVIHAMDDNGNRIAVAVIECKAPGVILGESAADQLIDYCNMLGCNYAMMVNDCESFAYYYDENRNEYISIDGLPVYEALLEGKYTIVEPGVFPDRIHHKDISAYLKENLSENAPDISYQTEHRLACAAFNLLEGLYDPRHKLPVKQYKLFSLIEDYGCRLLSYGNASGGIFDGWYRSFLIDVNGSTEFVSIGLSTCCSYAHPDVVKTAFNVAIDNERASHHSLQLVLDDNVIVEDDRFHFYHHGRIAVGHMGSGRVAELRALVAEKYPQLICGKKFYLGSLTNDRDWDLDDPEVAQFIENLISYALIRDEYRAQIKGGGDA